MNCLWRDIITWQISAGSHNFPCNLPLLLSLHPAEFIRNSSKQGRKEYLPNQVCWSHDAIKPGHRSILAQKMGSFAPGSGFPGPGHWSTCITDSWTAICTLNRETLTSFVRTKPRGSVVITKPLALRMSLCARKESWLYYMDLYN